METMSEAGELDFCFPEIYNPSDEAAHRLKYRMFS